MSRKTQIEFKSHECLLGIPLLGLLACCLIVVFGGCKKPTQPLTIWYSSDLALEKVEWAEDLARDIKTASGLHVNVKRRPFLSWGRDSWLALGPEDFRDWGKGDYATISLENEIGFWLQATLGIRWLAPGEVEWDGTAPRIIPFTQWVTSTERTEQATFLRRHLRGADRGRILRWAHLNGLYPQTDRSHSHYRIIRPEHFNTHPHLFAKDANGRPMLPPYPVPNQYNDQPDLLEPEVVERIADAAIAAFRAEADRDDFSILPNDSYVFGHIPEEYSALRPDGYYNELLDYSNYVYDFGNRVAKRVAEKFPEKYLLLHPYMNWLNVPDIPLHSMLTGNIADDRTQWYDPAYKRRDLELINDWAESDMALPGVIDYIFGFGFLIPRSLVGIVSESIPTFYEKGLRRYRGFVGPLWGYDAHTTWLAAQLTWDASQDPERLLEEFFRLYYGPAAVPMREFFDEAERIWMNQQGTGRWLRHWKNPHQAALYGDAELEELERWLVAAEKAVASHGATGGEKHREERFARRVGYTRDLFEMTERFVKIVHLRWAISIGGYGEFEPAYRPYDLGKLDLGSAEGVRSVIARLNAKEAEFRAEAERLMEKTYLHGWLGRIDWVFKDDPGSRALERVGGFENISAHNTNGSSHWRVLFKGWDGWRTIWRVSMVDTEDAVIEQEGGFIEARNVFRGFVHRSTRAKENNYYRAIVPITGQVGPSSFIYARLDFYDENLKSLGSSQWDRLPPGNYRSPFEIGPVMESPKGTAYVRLYLRFFYQEKGDWLRVGEPALMETY